jgi:predicted extracellular nuclease
MGRSSGERRTGPRADGAADSDKPLQIGGVFINGSRPDAFRSSDHDPVLVGLRLR